MNIAKYNMWRNDATSVVFRVDHKVKLGLHVHVTWWGENVLDDEVTWKN